MSPPLAANALAIAGSPLCRAKSAKRRTWDECRSDPKIIRVSACPVRMAANAPSKSVRLSTATGCSWTPTACALSSRAFSMGRVRRLGRIPQDSHAGQRGQGLLEQF
jgi:hypothetical protein